MRSRVPEDGSRPDVDAAEGPAAAAPPVVSIADRCRQRTLPCLLPLPPAPVPEEPSVRQPGTPAHAREWGLGYRVLPSGGGYATTRRGSCCRKMLCIRLDTPAHARHWEAIVPQHGTGAAAAIYYASLWALQSCKVWPAARLYHGSRSPNDQVIELAVDEKRHGKVLSRTDAMVCC